MSKFTPGPWRLNRPHPTKMHEGLFGGDGRLITYFKVDMRREDARLIAEAPAMAEELAHLLALIEPALESGVTIPGLATMNRTRALLARLEEK